VGPSGVGKTETAIALADTLYGGEQKLITINMSEYQEAYTISGLKGSPPGYVGYGQGGILTEAVRRSPYSVVLLDEVEKAHPEVLELFYSVFDKGLMKDTEGLTIDFKNTVIILTSNACSGLIMTASEASTRQTPAELIEKIRPGLLRHFKPALLGRLVIVPYYPLGHDDISSIARLKLARVQERFRTKHKAELTYDEELIKAIISRCTENDTGARNVDRIITQNILPELSRVLLQSMVSGKQIQKVHTYIGNDQEFACLVKL
jgi:type VI secretion system protein VasG